MPRPLKTPNGACRTFVAPPRHLFFAAFFGLIGATALPAFAQRVENVEVRGAQFIPEMEIQMTCGAEAGVSYLELELRAIESCLMSTGVFETVELAIDGDTLVIAVQELNTRPGRIDATLGYASQDGVIGSLSYERYNLFDRTYGAFNLEFNSEIQRYGANLYRTEAFGTSLDLGFELVGGRDEYDDLSYSHESIRAETYIAWDMTPSTQLEGGIGYRDHRQYDVDATASALLQGEQTNGISAPYLRLGLHHGGSGQGRDDGADDWMTFAYSIDIDQYFWNLGTDDPLFDTRLAAKMQFPMAQNLRLLFGFDAGAVTGGDGNTTRAIDRFFPGADSFRGFAPRGIGPRDGGDALGANSYVKASIELQRDFGDLYRIPFRGGVFVDTGASWDLDDTLGGAIDDTWHRRSSVGLSLTFDLGNTPVSLYVAKPFEKEAGDDEQVFGMTLTARF